MTDKTPAIREAYRAALADWRRQCDDVSATDGDLLAFTASLASVWLDMPVSKRDVLNAIG